ncbi:MAG: SpoIIE family protein phosphatase [Bacteroidetes bacterium]|nr:SpoIIE family protein phosphatase [Bacteroidota bacterium]
MRFRFPRITFFRGLAFRYSIFFLIAIVMILFVPLVIGYGSASVLLFIKAQKEATILTEQTVARFKNVLQPTELVPQTLVQAMENPNINAGEVLRIARDFVRHDTVVFGTCLAFEPYLGGKDSYWYAPYAFEKHGRLTTRILGSSDYDYFKMDWYRLPKLLNMPVWTEPYYDAGGGDTLMCTYSTPVYRNVGGKRIFTGVLTMDVSLSSFSRMVKSVNIFKTGYGVLISRQGKIIASPRPVMNNQNILDITRVGKGKLTQLAVRGMMAGKSGFSSMDGLEAKKFPSFLSYAPVGKTGWSFGILFPEEELYDDMYKFLKVMSWMFGISIFILLITTILITRKMTRPIVRLVEATHKIGQGDFNAKLPVRKSKDEVAQLTRAFGVMQDELRNYIHHLEVTTTEKEKIESELKVAHNIQMGMLPRGFSTPDNWDLFATLDPAKAVGGDLYDFFYLDADHLCIAIGDVAGKGVPASLFMMVTRTLLRAKAVAGTPINLVMQSINHELCQDNPSQMFVTFFAGIVDLKTGEMEFCNAGHNYPYVLGSGEQIRQLKVRNGLPFGIYDTADYTSSKFSFNPGEILVLTTDGITDALNITNDFFGEAKLAASLTALASKNTRALTELLIGELKRFSSGAEQADDITILALQYKTAAGAMPPPAQTVQLTLLNQVSELDKLAARIEELSGTWNIPPKTGMEVNLVLEELFTNVVFYAFDDQHEHTIIIDFVLTDVHQLLIRLEDDGKPFNLLETKVDDVIDKPLEERQIGGLGVHFVRKMMDSVEYRRDGDKNIVTLTKNF